MEIFDLNLNERLKFEINSKKLSNHFSVKSTI